MKKHFVMKKYFILIFAFLFSGILLQAQQTITIGTGILNQRGPISNHYGYERRIEVYKPSDGLVAGYIKNLAWKKHSSGSAPVNIPVKIYLKEIPDTSIASSQIIWDTLIANAVDVFDGITTAPVEQGWMDVSLQAPFYYSGIGSLMVMIATNLGGGGASEADLYYYYTLSSSNTHAYLGVDNSIQDNMLHSFSLDDQRSDIRILFSPTPEMATCASITNLKATDITSSGANLTWNVNGLETQWLVSYKASSSATWIDLMADASTFPLPFLQPNTDYEAIVRSFCGAGDTGAIRSVSFYIPQPVVQLPFSEDFETMPDWILVNGTQTNKWYIGAADNTNNTQNGSKGLYISNSDGTTNSYGHNASYTYATKLVQFDNAGDHSIEYDWKANGDANSDYLNAWLAPSTAVVRAGFMLNATNWINLFGSTNLCLQSSWQHKQVVFTIPQPGIYKLIFYWTNDWSTGSNPPAAVDNIFIEEIPCSRPTGISIDGITTNNANIHFRAPANAQSVKIYYKPVNASVWDSVSVPVFDYFSDTVFLLTNLLSGTKYQYYLKTTCPSGYSLETNTYIFQTQCAIISSLPWTESFEGITSDNEIPSCMAATRVGAYVYTSMSSSLGNRSAKTGSKYAYFQRSANDYIFTPQMTLMAGASYRFSFWYVTDGFAGWQKLEAKICNGQREQDTLATIGVPLTNVTNMTYKRFLTDFIPDSSGTYVLAIHCVAPNEPSYLTIDDIQVDYTPICPDMVTDLNLSGFADTSTANLVWNSTGSAFNVEYRKSTETTWQSAGQTTNTTFSLTNLDMNTQYEVRVQAKCGEVDLGEFSAFQFNTLSCTPLEIAAIPFYEGFDAVTTPNLPACWKKIMQNSNASISTTSSESVSSPNSVSINNNISSSAQSTILVSPPISPNVNIANLRTRFFVESNSNGNLQVGIITNPDNLATFVPVDTVDFLSGRINNGISGFSNVSQPTTIWHIAYKHGNASENQQIYIDDINIEAPPLCPDILNFECKRFTDDSIYIEYVSTATNFNVEYRVAGTTAWTSISANNTVWGIGGLLSNTRYEIRAQSVCGSNRGFYSYSVFCTTNQRPATIPFTENFETEPDWLFINGTRTNKWAIGTAANTNNTTGGMYGLYISNDDGITNAYSDYSFTYVYAVKKIQFSNAGDYDIEYDWKSDGEADCDYSTVWLAPDDAVITAGISPTTANWINLDGNSNLQMQNTWQHKQLTFTIHQPDVYKLVFYWTNDNDGGSQPPVAIDNISITALSCSRPQNVTLLSIGSDSANVAWNSSALNFIVEYKETADPDWRSINNIATSSVILRNLLPNTTYQVRVRAVCSTSDTSLWSDVYDFRTACSLASLPLIEGFETTMELSPAVPDCWSYIADGGAIYASTYYLRTGTKGYRFEFYPSQSVEAMLISPYLSPDINTLRLKFWMKDTWYTGCKAKVGYMSNPTDASTFREVALFDVPATWTEFVASFDTVTGTGHYIAISANTPISSYHNYFCIDDIKISLIPECPDVLGARAADTTQTSVRLNWNNVPSAMTYEIQYKTIEDTQWTTAPSVTTNTCIISGLRPNTDYEARLRTRCNTVDSGEWANPITFATLCGVASFPFLETFSRTKFPPNCWEKYSGLLDLMNPVPVVFTAPIDESFTWCAKAFANNSETGSISASFNIYGSDRVRDWFITPIIDLGNLGDAILEFDLAITKFGSQSQADGTREDDKFMVLLSADDSWTVNDTIAVWSNDVGASRIFNDISDTGEHITIPLTNITGNVKIAFYGVSTINANGDNTIFIDNVSVANLVCDTVTTVTATVAGTSVKVDWTAPAEQTEWKVVCLEAGSPIGSQIVNATTYTFGSLERDVTYAFEVYNICSSGDTSEAVVSMPVTINRCDTVSDITVTNPCPTWAIVNFTAPAGQNQWQLSYKHTTSNDILTKIIDRNLDTLTRLTPNASYEVEIRPVCGVEDTGIYSEPVSFQMGTCTPIENLMVPRWGAAGDSIFASWNNNECHLNWEMSVVPMGSPRGDEFVMVNTYQGVFYKVADPSRSYDVYVRGNCGNGEYGEWVMATSYPLGIAPSEASSSVKVTLAPNPARDYTQLSIEGVSGEVEMTLLTLEGKLLKKETINCRPSITKDVTLQGLSKGTYLIRLVHKNWTKVEKLIVQ